MMQTINVSLPKKMSINVEKVIRKEGYASKSDFFRTLIRLYFYLKEDALSEVSNKKESFFLPFEKKPIAKIKQDFRKTGKYSEKFIQSVISGLKKSSVYEDKAIKEGFKVVS